MTHHLAPWELHCPRELAIWLGAFEPGNLGNYRDCRARGDLLLRDPLSLRPMFWPLLPGAVAFGENPERPT